MPLHFIVTAVVLLLVVLVVGRWTRVQDLQRRKRELGRRCFAPNCNQRATTTNLAAFTNNERKRNER